MVTADTFGYETVVFCFPSKCYLSISDGGCGGRGGGWPISLSELLCNISETKDMSFPFLTSALSLSKNKLPISSSPRQTVERIDNLC